VTFARHVVLARASYRNVAVVIVHIMKTAFQRRLSSFCPEVLGKTVCVVSDVRVNHVTPLARSILFFKISLGK
jgi:hypothetical protein